MFAQALHDADSPDGVLDLSQLALELFDVLLHVTEDGSAAVPAHPRVVYDILCPDPLGLLYRQQLPHQVLRFEAHTAPVVGVEFYPLCHDFLLQLHLVL